MLQVFHKAKALNARWLPPPSLVLLFTHLVVGRWRGEQRNHNNHGGREAAQQYGEVEVVDAAEHGGGRVFNAASGQREGELQHHPAHAHHQTHHQAPEGSLSTHKHSQVSGHSSQILNLMLKNMKFLH